LRSVPVPSSAAETCVEALVLPLNAGRAAE